MENKNPNKEIQNLEEQVMACVKRHKNSARSDWEFFDIQAHDQEYRRLIVELVNVYEERNENDDSIRTELLRERSEQLNKYMNKMYIQGDPDLRY